MKMMLAGLACREDVGLGLRLGFDVGFGFG